MADKQVSYTIDRANRRITFNVKGHAALVFDMNKASEANNELAMFKGYAQQRIVDGAAIQRADKDGNVRTEAEMLRLKHASMSAIIAHLESGSPEWGMRQRGEKAETDHSLTIRALVEHFGKTYEVVNATIDKQATGLNVSRSVVLDNYAARPEIAELVRGYRAERSANVDTSVLWDELAEAE